MELFESIKEVIMFGRGKKKQEEKELEATIASPSEKDVEATQRSKDIPAVTYSGHEAQELPPVTATVTDQLEEEEEIPPLTYKEARALKKAKYHEVAPKFNTAYLLKNIRTGQIVELRAASSAHACNIIGWKPRKVRVLDTKIIEDSKTTTNQSEVAKEELPPGLR
jgi:hypothetical protein